MVRERRYARHMPLWLLFALMSIASFRLTRLVVTDDFPPILWLRTRIYMLGATWYDVSHLNDGQPGWEPRWWGKLVTCGWCASAYVAAGVVALTNVVADLPVPVLMTLAVWGTAAVLVDKLD